MAEPILIKKKRPDSQAQNFDAMRLEGIRYLQEIAGEQWTDYNVHDPGMTILEALCYAITDLGYRMGHSMEDLLAPRQEEGLNPKNFYSAREILTCNPSTEKDLRKIIIDVPGVRNAWLEITDQAELPIFYHQDRSSLVHKDDPKVNLADRFAYNGLYKGILEFEVVDGNDYNDNTYEYRFTINRKNSPLKGFEVTLYSEFNYWDEEDVDFANPEAVIAGMRNLRIDADDSYGDFDITLSIDEDKKVSALVIENKDGSTNQDNTLAKQLVKDITEFFFSSGIVAGGSLIELYQKKIQNIRAIIRQVLKALHKHRNLCEDFISFKSMKVEEIAICVDVEVETDARSHEVLATIYKLIEDFLSPEIPIYGLDELLALGLNTTEIFDGPRLNSGFILDEDLDSSRQGNVIHASDIINIIMDIEGVVAVRNLLIANFPPDQDDVTTPTETPWCLKLSANPEFVARLSRDRTKVTFYKESIPQVVSPDLVEQVYNDMYGEEGFIDDSPRLLDLPLPKGRNRNLARYTSVQEHFPLTYGIGEDGLPETSSSLRKAQANQLKGYLLFFEQLLANFHAQLDNLPQLFSMEPVGSRTYFTQPLYQVPRVARLLVHFQDYLAAYEQSNNVSLKTNSEINQVWELFKAEEDNAYRQSLDSIAESTSLFEVRRNKFLDHLVARFAENFSEYAMLMHDINAEISQSELIEDKLAFLQHYPAISYERGKGFDYTDPDQTWDTDNITGLQRRLSRLLGIDDPRRRRLSPKGFAESAYVRMLDESNGRFYYAVFPDLESNDEFIVRNTKRWENEEEAREEFRELLDYSRLSAHYERKKYAAGWLYFINNHEGEAVARSPYYASATLRDEAIETALSFFRNYYDFSEGMHVLEHILLRPLVSGVDAFLPIDNEEDERAPCPCIEDPYSFRVSIIMPAWPRRFTDMDFRNYIERKMRLETPAHIYPKICWVSIEQMDLFETALRDWLKAKADISFDVARLLDGESPSVLMASTLSELEKIAAEIGYAGQSPQPDDLQGIIDYSAAIAEVLEDYKGKDKGSLSIEHRRLNTQLIRLEKVRYHSQKLEALINALQALRSVYPLATLHDCDNSEGDNPVSLDNTVLGTFKPLDDE